MTFPTRVIPLLQLNLGVKEDCNKRAVLIFCCKPGLKRFRMNLLSHYFTIKLHVTDVSVEFSVSVFSIRMDVAGFFFTLVRVCLFVFLALQPIVVVRGLEL